MTWCSLDLTSISVDVLSSEQLRKENEKQQQHNNNNLAFCPNLALWRWNPKENEKRLQIIILKKTIQFRNSRASVN
jgi:hypothetical protein